MDNKKLEMDLSSIISIVVAVLPGLKNKKMWKYKFEKFGFFFLFLFAIGICGLMIWNHEIHISSNMGGCIKECSDTVVINTKTLAYIILTIGAIFLIKYVGWSNRFPLCHHDEIIEYYEKLKRTNPSSLMADISDNYEKDIEKQINKINKECEKSNCFKFATEEKKEIEKANRRATRQRNITIKIMSKILMDKDFIQKTLKIDPIFCLKFYNRFTTTNYCEDEIEYYFTQLIDSKQPEFMNDLIESSHYNDGEDFSTILSRTHILKYIFNENCTATQFKTNKLIGDAALKEIHSGCEIFGRKPSEWLDNDYKKTICYQSIKYWLCSFMYIHQDFMNEKNDRPYKDIYTEYLNHLTYDMIAEYGKYGNDTYAYKFTEDVSNIIRQALDFLKSQDNLDKLSYLVQSRLTITYSKCCDNKFDYSIDSVCKAFEEYITLALDNNKLSEKYLDYLKSDYENHRQIYKDALLHVSVYYRGKQSFIDLQEFIK